jgi:hypothetical protein
VGYEVHISRAVFWPDSERFPILADEFIELVGRSSDLAFRGSDGEEASGPFMSDYFSVDWRSGGEETWWLLYSHGQIQTKHPPDPVIRQMLELAAELDAWVIGDDCDVYEWDGNEVRIRQPTLDEVARDPGEPIYITRGSANSGLNGANPISPEEWLVVAAEQPDFRVDTTIEARLPSGVKRIPCPPVACWTGHPSGRVVRCFHDRDLVEVRVDDPATVRRMTEIAGELGAAVLR